LDAKANIDQTFMHILGDRDVFGLTGNCNIKNHEKLVIAERQAIPDATPTFVRRQHPLIGHRSFSWFLYGH
jgi:hypothetical protein